MSGKPLKGFQIAAVESGVKLFQAAKRLLDAAGDDAAGRAAAINHNGYLLVEAPTGSGKTLMAATIVERFSHEEDVVWFWFAPFKGVVGQTAASLRAEFPGLRLRSLAEDRAAAMSKRGDVFVTTWQAVVTRSKDIRNVRKEGDANPSIDTLIEMLRRQGLRIGVVVDEAHHGFGGHTQAAKFFQDVLQPEYTVLITATPDDDDIKEFERAMGIAELQRISVSRADAVDVGLIKTGVKCAAYFVDPRHKALVDLQGTALRDGVRAHRELKRALSELNVPLVPLLLVQADSTEQSVEKLQDRLRRHGFTEEQIAVHTAEEPDAGLLALANDERREVLIFKMAVALGFDAPRAFTLVSMRASRDPDFGVQLVGRILRVHRRLQAKAQAKTLPEPLNFGYVFLADAETQTGLDIAGQKINKIQTQYAKVSTATVVVRFGDGAPGIGMVDSAGQLPLFRNAPEAGELPTDADLVEEPPELAATEQATFDFGQFFGGTVTDVSAGESGPAIVAGPVMPHVYPLRPGVPRRFKTQVVSSNSDASEEDCANRFLISAREILDAMKERVPVEKRTLDVFAGQFQKDLHFAADLSMPQAAVQAQKVLLKNKTFDPRELRRALLRKVEAVLRDEVMPQAEDPAKVAHFLNVILATHPQLLYDAQKGAISQHAEIQEAAELPDTVESPEPLAASTRNVYGVMPPDLNTWEKPFAELLDHDTGNVVLWWHRNLPRKPWSINVLTPDGIGFYPDFVIGVKGRRTEDGALLADPKERYQSEEEESKVLAEHRAYGRVMILYLQGGTRWMTVAYDHRARKATIGREFRLIDAAGY